MKGKPNLLFVLTDQQRGDTIAAGGNRYIRTPVMDRLEGDRVVVDAGYDPSCVRVSGNVVGDPPYRGALRHRGWRVSQINLTPRPEGQDAAVVAPAEVEID